MVAQKRAQSTELLYGTWLTDKSTSKPYSVKIFRLLFSSYSCCTLWWTDTVIAALS